MKKQTFSDFYAEHRVMIIVLVIVIGIVFVGIMISSAKQAAIDRCTVPYVDKIFYKDLIYEDKWSAQKVNEKACNDYPECNCKNILGQIYYNYDPK